MRQKSKRTWEERFDIDTDAYAGARALVRDTMNLLYHVEGRCLDVIAEHNRERHLRDGDRVAEPKLPEELVLDLIDCAKDHIAEQIQAVKGLGETQEKYFGDLHKAGDELTKYIVKLDSESLVNQSEELHAVVDGTWGYSNWILRASKKTKLFCSRTPLIHRVANEVLLSGVPDEIESNIDEDFAVQVRVDDPGTGIFYESPNPAARKSDAYHRLTGHEALPAFYEGTRFVGPVKEFTNVVLETCWLNLAHHYFRIGHENSR